MSVRFALSKHKDPPIPVVTLDLVAPDGSEMDTQGPLGEEATARALQSTVGLVWRALLLWMLLLLLLSIAVWLGRPMAG